MEAISNAGSALGVLAKDGVVLAAEKKITSKVVPWLLLRPQSLSARRHSYLSQSMYIDLQLRLSGALIR